MLRRVEAARAIDARLIAAADRRGHIDHASRLAAEMTLSTVKGLKHKGKVTEDPSVIMRRQQWCGGVYMGRTRSCAP
jgi:hypothetical protein